MPDTDCAMPTLARYFKKVSTGKIAYPSVALYLYKSLLAMNDASRRLKKQRPLNTVQCRRPAFSRRYNRSDRASQYLTKISWPPGNQGIIFREIT